MLLHALPTYHVHGLFVACHCALLSRARMLWLPKFDPAEVRALLPHASVMMGVPTFYTRLLADPEFGAADCRSMRLFISGSAPLLPETFAAFRERTGHTILERYGMSETGMNTSNPLDGERIGGTVGPALPGVSVRVVDDSGKRCDSDDGRRHRGQGSECFFRLLADAREDPRGIHRGRLVPHRRHGHAAAQPATSASSGAPRTSSSPAASTSTRRKIEEKIDALPGVVESAVIGVADADFGEAVTAVVVPGAGHTLTEAGVIAALKAEIASFKVPKHVHFVDDLPRNSMGKVQKNVLRDRYDPTKKAR